MLILLLGLAMPSRGMIFYTTGDTNYNTSAPTGTLANSGWNYQLNYGYYFLATPIARHYYITAQHVNVPTNTVVYMNGIAYSPIAQHQDPSSDLEIRKVDKSFPAYAALYTNSNESGKDCVLFGRGVTRGDEIRMDDVLKGWRWGPIDRKKRWGENAVAGTPSVYLYCTFDAGAGTNECHIGNKDSSGGLFIEEDGEWKLAGIHYGADGIYNTNGTGTGFYGAVFDEGGLYSGSSLTGPWTYEPDTGPDKPGGFTSTRISSRIGWITNIIADEYDRDHDYIPDGWEATYSGSPTGLTASADDDGDGYSNFEEFVANTSPTNTASFPAIVSSWGPTNLFLTFNASTDRYYRVETADNTLAQSDLSWSPYGTNIIQPTGTPATVVVTNDLSRTGGLYRIGVFLP